MGAKGETSTGPKTLRAKRLALRLTLREVAAAVDSTAAMVRCVEEGKAPHSQFRRLIAAFLRAEEARRAEFAEKSPLIGA